MVIYREKFVSIRLLLSEIFTAVSAAEEALLAVGSNLAEGPRSRC